jgi:hypothetical protein
MAMSFAATGGSCRRGGERSSCEFKGNHSVHSMRDAESYAGSVSRYAQSALDSVRINGADEGSERQQWLP